MGIAAMWDGWTFWLIASQLHVRCVIGRHYWPDRLWRKHISHFSRHCIDFNVGQYLFPHSDDHGLVLHIYGTNPPLKQNCEYYSLFNKEQFCLMGPEFVVFPTHGDSGLSKMSHCHNLQIQQYLPVPPPVYCTSCKRHSACLNWHNFRLIFADALMLRLGECGQLIFWQKHEA